MTYRFILGLLVVVSLSGCGSGSATGTASDATTTAGATISGAASAGTAGTTVGAAATSTVAGPGGTSTITDAGGAGTGNASILLQGVPPSSVTVGGNYSFRPSVSSGGKVVTFAIQGQPSWTTFDTTTGTLSGTPATRDVGLSGPITITASHGWNSAALGPFTILVNALPSPAPTTVPSLTISGTPRPAVVSGNAYSFTPVATYAGVAALTFSIKNAPGWATFNSATGELSGTPTAADVATYSNITIGVGDGTTSVSLPAFAIAVTQIANGSATLSWMAPTQNTDGTALTNLSGYRIYYGTSQTSMTQSVQIAGSGILTYVISNLPPGTWYFSVRDYTSANVESGSSVVVSTTII